MEKKRRPGKTADVRGVAESKKRKTHLIIITRGEEGTQKLCKGRRKKMGKDCIELFEGRKD